MRLFLAGSGYLRTMTLRVRIGALLLLIMTGCSGAAPYERGRLAHRTMTTADLASPAEAHARAIQEGAMGGGFEAGGGCGCN
jgi:hypothetical protein